MKHLPAVLGGALGILLVVLQMLFPEPMRKLGGLLFQRPYLLLLLPAVVWAYYLPRYRRSARLTQEALALLKEGRNFAALEKFEAARTLARRRAVPTYNIGICRLRLWQLKESERELASVTTMEGGRHPAFQRVLLPSLALVAALEGRTREALQRLDEARTLGVDAAPDAVLASAVLACRRRDWSEARALLERRECSQLEGPSRGLRDAMVAWCVEQLTGERRKVEPLSVFGEASTDTLQAAWPELVAFLLERSRKAG
ncbi:hypothetical protein P2318_00465 [Myxococcaceae bacterium GXIMD 01537]